MINEDRIRRFEQTLEENKEGGTRVQAEAINRFLIPEPSAETTDSLWKYLVIGLMILILAGLVSLTVLTVEDKGTDAILPVLTALITGLFGLFVTSPTE